MENRRTQIGVGLLIFLCFLWTGSAYTVFMEKVVDANNIK